MIELLVALSVIAIGVATTVSIFSNASQWMSVDRDMQRAVLSIDRYLSDVYVASNMKQALFSEDDVTNLSARRQFPFLLPPWKTNVADGISLLVNRNVRNWDPLFCDVGIEAVISFQATNRKSKHFWVETTFSERYLGKLK
jgi:type II secretory pathway pseudopilin PulG